MFGGFESRCVGKAMAMPLFGAPYWVLGLEQRRNCCETVAAIATFLGAIGRTIDPTVGAEGVAALVAYFVRASAGVFGGVEGVAVSRWTCRRYPAIKAALRSSRTANMGVFRSSSNIGYVK